MIFALMLLFTTTQAAWMKILTRKESFPRFFLQTSAMDKVLHFLRTLAN